MCSYGSAVKWHPKRHGSATEHHHIYSAGNNLHWSCLLGPAIHVKHRFLKRNSPVLSCNFGHFNAESWRPFRADLLGELQVLAPQQRLVIFSPGGCHLVKVCLPFLFSVLNFHHTVFLMKCSSCLRVVRCEGHSDSVPPPPTPVLGKHSTHPMPV